MSQTSPRQTIRIQRTGQYLRITPPVEDLQYYLFAVKHEPVDDAVHGVRVEKHRQSLIWRQEVSGQVCCQCFAGLEPLVREVLAAAGFEVEMANVPKALKPPTMEKLAAFDAVDMPVLDLVQRHDRGLIRYDAAHVQPARVIAQIALAWPKAKIIVVATRLHDARKVRHELTAHIAKVRLFDGAHHPSRGSRVVVATYSALGIGAVEIEKRTIYIALNPAELFAGYRGMGIEGIRALHRARLYGLLADDVVVAPYPRSLVTALFGMQRRHIPQHGFHDLRVEVMFSRIFGGQRPPNHKDDLVIKRSGIWQHHVRNRRMASLLRAIVGKRGKTLQTKFPDIAPDLRERRRKSDRIGLLVENVDHALTLARLLPEVSLIIGSKTWTRGLTPDEVKVLNDSQAKDARRCAIVTNAGLAETERFDVLIRADGGMGLPALPGAYRMMPNDDDDARLLLIDFEDRHHPVLRRWSRQRRVAYMHADWTILGAGAPSLMDRFVAERPEVP